MGVRNGGAVLIPLIVFAAVLLGYRPAGSPPPKHDASSDRPVAPSRGPALVEKLLWEFLRDGSAETERKAPGNDAGVRWKTRFVIATVPDPVESRYDFQFDRYLDAIQRALEKDRYVLDRFTLPWLEKPVPDSAGPLPEPRYRLEPGAALFRKGTAGGSGTTANAEIVVVLLVGESPTAGVHKVAFRKALDLVGRYLLPQTTERQHEERPARAGAGSSGPRSREVAEKIAAAVSAHELGVFLGRLVDSPSPENDAFLGERLHRLLVPDTKQQEVLILGPSFSGSVSSMKVALRGWFESRRGKPSPVRIVSGSATAVSGDPFGEFPQVSFGATVLPDALARGAMIRMLTSSPFLARCDEIAFLSEGNTTYGQGIDPRIEGPGPSPSPSPSPGPSPNPNPSPGPSRSPRPSPSSGPDPGPTNLCGASGTPLYLTFPLHIGELRAQLDKDDSREGTDPLKGLVRGNVVPLDLQQSVRATDVPPLTSTLESSSAELLLSAIYGKIQREKVRYLCLTASDVRDKILLARELRNHCPDRLLISFANDVTFLHSSTSRDFLGSLVLTPYPLISINQRWSYPFEGNPRSFFPNQNAEGVYNAALALLKLTHRMVEYGQPFDLAVAGATEPPLWITAVGRDGFWPLDVLDVTGSRTHPTFPLLKTRFCTPLQVSARVYPVAWPASLFRGAYGRTTVIVFHMLCLLCIVPAWSMIARLGWAPRGGSSTAPLGCLFPRALSDEFEEGATPEAGKRPPRRAYLLAFALILLILALVLVTMVLLPLEAALGLCAFTFEDSPTGIYPLIWAVFLALTSLAMVLLAIWAVLSRGLRDKRARPPTDVLREPVVIGTALLVVLALLVCRSWLSLGPKQQLFLFLRSASPSNGLSPLPPLVLVCSGGLLFVACCLKRMRASERRDAAGPVLDFGTGSHEGLRALEAETRENALRSVGRLRAALPITALVLMIGGCVFSPLHGSSFETREYDWLFAVAYTSLYIALLLAVLRLVLVWRSLRKVLRQVSAHPLLAGFEALRKDLAKGDRIDLWSGGQTVRALQRSVAIADSLARTTWPSWSRGSSLDPSREAGPQSSSIPDLVTEAERSLAEVRKAYARGDLAKMIDNRAVAQKLMSRLSSTVATALEPAWGPIRSLGDRPGAGPSMYLGGERTGRPRPGFEDRQHDIARLVEWRELGEKFLASRVVEFVQEMFAHIKSLATCVTAGLLLMLLAVGCYPFLRRDLYLQFNWICILSIVLVTVLVFVQMNRNTVLSILTGSVPNRVSWDRDFLFKIALYGILPVLGLLGAQFPTAFQQMVPWLYRVLGVQH